MQILRLIVQYHRIESFIHFTYFEAIPLVNTEKNREGEMVYLPENNLERASGRRPILNKNIIFLIGIDIYIV